MRVSWKPCTRVNIFIYLFLTPYCFHTFFFPPSIFLIPLRFQCRFQDFECKDIFGPLKPPPTRFSRPGILEQPHLCHSHTHTRALTNASRWHPTAPNPSSSWLPEPSGSQPCDLYVPQGSDAAMLRWICACAVGFFPPLFIYFLFGLRRGMCFENHFYKTITWITKVGQFSFKGCQLDRTLCLLGDLNYFCMMNRWNTSECRWFCCCCFFCVCVCEADNSSPTERKPIDSPRYTV